MRFIAMQQFCKVDLDNDGVDAKVQGSSWEIRAVINLNWDDLYCEQNREPLSGFLKKGVNIKFSLSSEI